MTTVIHYIDFVALMFILAFDFLGVAFFVALAFAKDPEQPAVEGTNRRVPSPDSPYAVVIGRNARSDGDLVRERRQRIQAREPSATGARKSE